MEFEDLLVLDSCVFIRCIKNGHKFVLCSFGMSTTNGSLTDNLNNVAS